MENPTEGLIIVQYLADQNPASGLIPRARNDRSLPRPGMAELRHFGIAQDLRPVVPSDYAGRIQELFPGNFSASASTGSTSSSAGNPDGRQVHCRRRLSFTVLRWSARVGIDLSKWPNITAHLDRVAARPKVREAMQAEGLLQ